VLSVSIASLFKAAVFNMLLVAETANSDRPSIGFCNYWLLGGKYAGFALAFQ
jgi:hypothetical protein